MKILEFMVGVKKGLVAKSLSEWQNLALRKVEFYPSKVIFSTLPGISYNCSRNGFNSSTLKKSSGLYLALCPKNRSCVRQHKVKDNFMI